MTMKKQASDFNHPQAADLMRMMGNEVVAQASGGYLLNDGAEVHRLTDKELLVFSAGFIAGFQARPVRTRKRKTD